MADGGNPIVNLIGQLFGLLGGQGPDWGPTISSNSTIGLSNLSGVGDFLQTAVDGVKSIFKNIWNDIILAVLKHILDAISKLRQLLQKVFGPVISLLKTIRKLYDQYFNQFVKPVLNILQKIRAFLKIFELLGFKWAKRLDADIATIENKILAVYTTLRKYLNETISIVQLIVDPTGILRRNPLFAAIIRSGNELKNLMLTVEQRPLSGDESDRQSRDLSQASKATQKQNFQNYYSQRMLTPDDEESRACFNTYFDALQDGGDVSV